MKKFSFKILIFAMICLSVLLYAEHSRRLIQLRLVNHAENILEYIPSFKLQDIRGGYFDSDNDVAGHETIVHFWATWCAPCKDELPSFLELDSEFENHKKLIILLIATKDTLSNVKEFLVPYNSLLSNRFHVLIDESGQTLPKFGTMKVPETFVFNRQAMLKKRFIGPQNWDNSSIKMSLLNSINE